MKTRSMRTLENVKFTIDSFKFQEALKLVLCLEWELLVSDVFWIRMFNPLEHGGNYVFHLP
jgi:hypothetical protein